jgi:glutamate dehydrogenase/leucine dehydrogenase
LLHGSRHAAAPADAGPAKVVLIRDLDVALEATVVIDNVACGPAIGGVRMAEHVTVDEVARWRVR